MTPPTLEEVQTRANEIGLASLEAEKFWMYFDSKGWVVGKSPMKNWRSALSGWKLRSQPSAHTLSGVDKMILAKEYDRIIARMDLLKATYGGHQDWDPSDRLEFHKLRQRRDELRKLLGILI
jgi:hypothetical protein